MGWLVRDKRPDPRSFVQRLPAMSVTFVLVCFGWLLFRAENVATVGTILTRIVGQMDLSFMRYSKSIVLFVALMLAAEWWHLPWPRRRWMRWAVYYLLIALMLWKATASTQFIYFQF